MSELSLIDRFVRRLPEAYENPHRLDKDDLAIFAGHILDEAEADLRDGGRVRMALALHEHLPQKGKLPFTERVLHNTMFYTWLNTKDVELQTKIARRLLTYPSFMAADCVPVIAQWNEAINVATMHCFDQRRLKRLLLEASEHSNKILVSKVFGRLLELASMPEKIFLAKCVNALGENPNSLPLVRDHVIGITTRLTQLAEWSFSFALCLAGVEIVKISLVEPDTIVITGNRLESVAGTRADINLVQNEIRARLRKKWVGIAKEGDQCSVRLVIDGHCDIIHFTKDPIPF